MSDDLQAPSPEAPTVRVTRLLPASAERVFDAWIDPAWLARWMFGPEVRDETIIALRVDARVGGEFSFRVSRQGQVIDHVGRYEVLDRPRLLVFTWGIAGQAEGGSCVRVSIAARGPCCELTLTHTLDERWADYAQRTRAGWSHMVDQLERCLSDAAGQG